ncbi:MAG: hypothetical protein NUW37_02435 [Planctomycetes bacterium]|nr:hypothetical protein [Planctomycetota bacterium]
MGLTIASSIVTYYFFRPVGEGGPPKFVSLEGKDFYDRDASIASSHTKRLVLIIVVLIVLAFAVKGFLVPKSFGQDGFYRADALVESSDREPRHMTSESCGNGSCHKYEIDDLALGLHFKISCISCHGAMGHSRTYGDVHAEDATTMQNGTCLECHQKLTGRPANVVPQVDMAAHQREYAYESGEGCIDCHSKHNLMLIDENAADRKEGGQ